MVRLGSGGNSVITHVFRDEHDIEYLVTIWDDGSTARLAIRAPHSRTWSAPVEHIRTERTETE